MAQLGIDLPGRIHRLRHRLPQQLAVALAQSLDRFPDRLDTQAELGGGSQVGRTFLPEANHGDTKATAPALRGSLGHLGSLDEALTPKFGFRV